VTELTLIATLKPGVAAKYKEALAASQASPSPIFSKISTIHFARWVLFDNDTRLIFCSNFDGRLEDYLRDFSVQMPDQMDGAFGVCEGYPAKGCRDFEAFQQFVSDRQVPTNLFYAAYPEVSVKNVQRAVAMKKLTDAYVRQLG
jgi:hypothetical protein